MENTQTPWRIGTHGKYDGRPIIGNEINGYICTTSGNAEANARHIIKCVNSHDALIDALLNAESYIKKVIELDGRESIDEDCTSWTMETIQNALKQAESEVTA